MLLLSWLIIGFVTFLFSRIVLRHYPTKLAYSWRAAIISASCSFPVAFIFAPTLLVSGWFGFPAPAGYVLMRCLLDSTFKRNNNELVRTNLGTAIIMITGCWFIAWLFFLLRSTKKLETANTLNVGKLTPKIGLAAIIFAIVFYYFAFCYAHPPSGIPVYQGP